MLAIFMIIGAILLRLVPHIPNMAPIGAMALFAGVYLNKKYALILPLVVMVISDSFLGFHKTILFVYSSFLLIGLLGLFLKQHKNVFTTCLVTFASSVLFFIITNFGVWMVGGLYPKSISGIAECYYFALPFFRNTIIGDFFYVTVLFGSYELVYRLVHQRLIKVI